VGRKCSAAGGKKSTQFWLETLMTRYLTADERIMTEQILGNYIVIFRIHESAEDGSK
jgi:hypothetical protein